MDETNTTTAALSTDSPAMTALHEATYYVLDQAGRYGNNPERKAVANSFYNLLPMLAAVRKALVEGAPTAPVIPAGWRIIRNDQDEITVSGPNGGQTIERGDRHIARRTLYELADALLAAPAFDMLAHLHRQREWSERTFGPGERTAGCVDHIRKELIEVEADPHDLGEWIDVVMLALDGAWRIGASPEQIVAALQARQTRNEGRTWPDWRTADPNKAIEHVRVEEAAVAVAVPGNHLPVHVSVIRDIEHIGRQCLDSGRCHHGCTTTCARKASCVPLSIAESYLSDDWKVRAAAPAATKDGTLEQLEAIGGYFQDGSTETISIGPDDATRTWHVSVAGKHFGYGTSIRSALTAACANRVRDGEKG